MIWVRYLENARIGKQWPKLSYKLDLAIRRALAKPTMKIMKYNQLDNRTNFIPVLPLILGGDELFALIPAPWALDFALSFCRAYEQEMRKVYGDEDIELEQQVPQPTTIGCDCDM